jgi:chaperonin cofactor prefoldin
MTKLDDILATHVKKLNPETQEWEIIEKESGQVIQSIPVGVTGTIVDHIPKISFTTPTSVSQKVAHFQQITEELSRIYEDKNKRYRDSFNKTLDKRGLVAALTRLDDKMNRLDYLVEGLNASISSSEEEAERVAALIDTLNDAANYLIMTRMWLENRTT